MCNTINLDSERRNFSSLLSKDGWVHEKLKEMGEIVDK
jgi:hypothetical protein